MNKLKSIERSPFQKEIEIQNLVEKNVETLFGIELVSSEFKIGEFRIDTLCFDKETNSFVIIEYKNEGNSSNIVISRTTESIGKVVK